MPSRSDKPSGNTRRGAARRKTSTRSSASSAAKTQSAAKPPKGKSVARSSKKPKPTFDVAREPIGDTKSGWVYRSESLHTATLREAVIVPEVLDAPEAPDRLKPREPR